MGKTYVVQLDWFRKTDSAGFKISDWCTKVSESEVFCSMCKKKISCVSKGFAALGQHVTTALHKQSIDIKLNKNQMLFKYSSVSTNDGTESNNPCKTSIELFCQKEMAIKAEIIWALKSVQCNMAVHSCDDIKDIFQAMFPGSVPENFNLAHTKLSYMITEGLGPYFYDKLIEEVGDSYFSLLYDETTNNEHKKELQIFLRFWSEEKKEIVCRFLTSIFLGCATAVNIVKSIHETLHDAKLKIGKLIVIGCDGPNTNKAVKRILSNQLSEERNKPLMDIGSCNIHTVHNAFLKGIEQFGDECVELIINIYYFFKNFPSRWENFERIQLKVGVPLNRFIKHCPTRWLTVTPAAERLLQQWPALEEYFLKFIPCKAADLMKTSKYQYISKCLKGIDIKLECEFVIESAKIFTKFTRKFQETEPLVHILHDELSNILKVLAGRVCKKDEINIDEEIDSKKKLLPLHKIDCSDLKSFSALREQEILKFKHNVQQHFVTAYNYLFSNCLQNDLLKQFKCLQPAEINKSSSIKKISKLAGAMFTDFNISVLKDEWRLLQLDYKQDKKINIRVDSFWSKIIYSTGTVKYPHIAQVVKAALSVSHGNSDVERGFSLSGRVLTEDKSSMSQRMLSSRLLIRDALLKRYGNRVCNVPLTKELLKLCQNAYRSYQIYLEDQKRIKKELLAKEKEDNEKYEREQQFQKDLVVKRESIKCMEKKAEEIEKQKQDVQKTSDTLLKEAKERLSIAINKNDADGIRVAQGLLIGAEELRKEERKHEEEASKVNKVVNKRKSALIEQYVKAKTRKIK